jgi:hypothetical protein
VRTRLETPSLSAPTGLAVGLALKEIALRNGYCDSPRPIQDQWFPRSGAPWRAGFGWFKHGRVADRAVLCSTSMATALRKPPVAAGDRERLDRATAALDPPFALLDLDAFWANADDMVSRAAGKPIRLASKSLRCRTLQERTLARDGFRGTLAFTLPEALWLASEGFEDLVVA